MKTCTNCDESKPLYMFHKQPRNKTDGRQSQCKECQKLGNLRPKRRLYMANLNLIKNFGITLDQYNEMLEKQNGLCHGCQKHYSEFKKRLAVDHCHITGKIRGLLCDNCNRGLGLLGDSKETLQRLADYLTQFQL